jgi:galactose mutarotase-like enzyme
MHKVEWTTFAGRTVIRLVSGSARVSVLPRAGMLVRSFWVGGWEFLKALAPVDAFVEAGAVTGMPLLLPANRQPERATLAGRDFALPKEMPGVLRDENGHWLHGFRLGTGDWRVTAGDASTGGVYVSGDLDLDTVDGFEAAFPWRGAHLKVSLNLVDTSLSVITSFTTERDPLPIPGGWCWHPNLVVPGPRRSWSLTAPADVSRLVLEHWRPTGRTEPWSLHGRREFDDCLCAPADAVFGLTGEDDEGTAAVTVALGDGYPYAQVWDGPGCVAVEPSTATPFSLGTKPSTFVEPGRPFVASFVLRGCLSTRS